MSATEPPADLRAAIAEVIKRAKGVRINSGEGWGGFTYLTDGKQDIDAILRLCEAAALAAAPEKKEIPDSWKVLRPELVKRVHLNAGYNQAIVTYQANLHKRFGGSNG